MDTEFIQLKGVTKKFGKNVVLNSIDLSISEGKITGIIGASGEGKSTILKLIASFYKPTKGEIFYYKRNITKDIKNIKKHFGIAIEEGSFYENLSVKENLIHFGKLYHVKSKILKKRANDLMKFLGLYEAKDVYAKNLSLGMKKRLDLACSLIHRPRVLILDEPTADLDPLLRKHMLDLIKKINADGTTVIFTTQLLEETNFLCDDIAILYNEKIVEQGSIKKIKTKYKTEDMNKIFNKIFTAKDRKIYKIKDKKSKLNAKKEEKEIRLRMIKKQKQKTRGNKK